jgi:hypothetical protein
MKKVVETDIVIIGGGIAGLWLLNRLRHTGFSVILLESNTLGGEQTHKAQGIIHGGIKYALQGQLTPAAQAIADMPLVWKKCLQGRGEINLLNVPILSNQQYLWSRGMFSAKMAGFLANIALKSHTKRLTKEFFPEIFQNAQFKGQVYSLNETVIDVSLLLRELMQPNQDVIFKIDPMAENQIELDNKDRLISLKIQAAPLPSLQVNAQKFIFTAGSGNALLLKKLKYHTVRAQHRSLHMVIVKHDLPYSLYAHCLGLSTTPRLTITTHKAHDGKLIWYLGGQIAETGVKLTSAQQVQVAKKELKKLFSWLDFSTAQFASFYVDRVENRQPNGGRPDSYAIKEVENMLIAWPTKLAFAPLLATEMLHLLMSKKMQPCIPDLSELRAWPIPALAKPIWDQLL